MDKLDAGLRKCKFGYCSKRTEEWEDHHLHPPQSSSAEHKSKISARCGYCDICRRNCIKEGRKREEYCETCLKKADKVDTRGKGCKFRDSCKQQGKGAAKGSDNRNEQGKKNKAMESPEGKVEAKTAKTSVTDN